MVCCVVEGNVGFCGAPVPAHQPPSLPTGRPVLSPVMDRPVSAFVPCHGWTPPGYQRQYSGAGEMEPTVGGQCPAASPYPSPPLSTHGRPTSGADMRWSPVSQLGADDSWPCGDLSAKNQQRSSLPVDLVGSGDVMPGDFDFGQSGGRHSVITAYTGI